MATHRILSFVRSGYRPAVMATIVEAEGHTYRKAGACMLFVRQEEPIGHISPGCLETDLQIRSEEVWRSGSPVKVEYDMRRDDPIWGETVGCGGKIGVLLEPVRGLLHGLLVEIARLNDEGKNVWLDRLQTDEGIRYRLLTEVPQGKGDCFSGERPCAPTPFLPQTRLVIFGAGVEARFIAALAETVGFRIAVGDWREEVCNENDFPHAELAFGSAEEIIRNLGVGSNDFILVCSHHFERDKLFVQAVFAVSPVYLGVIGSKARISGLMEGVETDHRIKAPVGLAIGAEGAEEIAVSIVAELIQERRKIIPVIKTGGIRSESSGDLFSGWSEPANGSAEAFPRTVCGENIGECGIGAAEQLRNRSAYRSSESG